MRSNESDSIANIHSRLRVGTLVLCSGDIWNYAGPANVRLCLGRNENYTLLQLFPAHRLEINPV